MTVRRSEAHDAFEVEVRGEMYLVPSTVWDGTVLGTRDALIRLGDRVAVSLDMLRAYRLVPGKGLLR